MSAVRSPSVKGAMPPASSMRIIIEVPERGRPDTTTTAGPGGRRRSRRRIASSTAVLQRDAEAALQREARKQREAEEGGEDAELSPRQPAEVALGRRQRDVFHGGAARERGLAGVEEGLEAPRAPRRHLAVIASDRPRLGPALRTGGEGQHVIAGRFGAQPPEDLAVRRA